MLHNDKKISTINKLSTDYYYTSVDRDYVHSTTFVLLAWLAFSPTEVTVSLRTPVEKGFTFSDLPSEEDVGYLQIDNTVLYIKCNKKDLKKISDNDMDEKQRLLFRLQSMLTSGSDVMNGSCHRLLSRKLSVFCPLLFQANQSSIELKRTNTSKFTMFDILFDSTTVWRQFTWMV